MAIKTTNKLETDNQLRTHQIECQLKNTNTMETDKQLNLIKPNELYFQSYQDALKETPNELEKYGYLDMPCEDLKLYIENFLYGNGLPDGYVRSTYLWLVQDQIYIGQVNIRHALTENLEKYGGHIGYSIRKSEQGKGYGSEMLAKTLEYVKQNFNFSEVLITCDDDNYASAKVIEKNSGILQNKIVNTIDGQKILTRRYWITIKED